MYSVVGCNGCSNLWIVEGRPKTTNCPRCGKRRQFRKLKKFIETDDEDHAREMRASMLANRQGQGEAFAELDSFAALDSQADDAGMDDETFLDRSGLNTEEISAAGERTKRRGNGKSKKAVVLNALDVLDRPTEDEIIEYASERGVAGEYVEKALRKLARRGEISESGGRYRRL